MSEPGVAQEGQCWILGEGATGPSWSRASKGSIVTVQDGAWREFAPRAGWIAYIRDADELVLFDGESWRSVTQTPIDDGATVYDARYGGLSNANHWQATRRAADF